MKILLEYSYFNSCTSQNNRGCYYSRNPKGSCVQQQNCYMNSVAKENIAFYQVSAQNNSSLNYAHSVSVSNCGKATISTGYVIVLAWGSIQADKINFTKNIAGDNLFYPRLDGSNGNVTFCNIYENNQTKYDSHFYPRLISLGSNTASLKYDCHHCNVVSNKCEDTLLLSDYSSDIDSCIFDKNEAKTMFICFVKNKIILISNSYVSDFRAEKPGYGTTTTKSLHNNNDIIINFNLPSVKCHYSFKQPTYIMRYYNPINVFYSSFNIFQL